MQRHRGQTVPTPARLGQPVQTFCPPWTPSLYVLYVPAMDNGGRPDVVLRGVTKRFGDLVAVDDVDLEVQPGEFLALLGPSGCGKTTTLRMIAGFDEPTAGEIEIGGRPAGGGPPHKSGAKTGFPAPAPFPPPSPL